MPARQVDDVDVVAHASAVRRRVVVAEHPEFRPAPDRDLADVGHQVVGCSPRIFADQAAAMRTHRVEVTQQGDAPGGIASGEITQHLLDVQFRAPVGIGRLQREILADRHRMRVAINRRRRAEDHLLDACFGHRLAQPQRAQHVVVVIAHWLGDRFAHRLEAGEMDHRFDGKFPEGCGQRPGIANIALDETRTHAGDGLDALEHADGTVRQVVENHQIGGRPAAVRRPYANRCSRCRR